MLQYINVGNTAIVAEKLNNQIGGKCVELKSEQPYSVDYHETLQRSKQENVQHDLVAIEPINGLTSENQILLGFPIWWGTIPPVVGTFLSQNDLSGKEIYPFCTHEGSQFGRSIGTIKSLAPHATVYSGLATRGSKVYRAEQAIVNWLQYLSLEVTNNR